MFIVKVVQAATYKIHEVYSQSILESLNDQRYIKYGCMTDEHFEDKVRWSSHLKKNNILFYFNT